MNAPVESHPLGAALGRRFAGRARCAARDTRNAEAFSARSQNKRRNLNLDMIELMQNGKAFNSPEVQALRAELAKIPA
jgi:hypothetical protein